MSITKQRASFYDIIHNYKYISCVEQPHEVGGVLIAKYAPNKNVQIGIEFSTGILTIKHFSVTQPLMDRATILYYYEEEECGSSRPSDEMNFILVTFNDNYSTQEQLT